MRIDAASSTAFDDGVDHGTALARAGASDRASK